MFSGYVILIWLIAWLSTTLTVFQSHCRRDHRFNFTLQSEDFIPAPVLSNQITGLMSHSNQMIHPNTCPDQSDRRFNVTLHSDSNQMVHPNTCPVQSDRQFNVTHRSDGFIPTSVQMVHPFKHWSDSMLSKQLRRSEENQCIQRVTTATSVGVKKCYR